MDSPKISTTPTAFRNRGNRSQGGSGSSPPGAPRPLLRVSISFLQAQEPRRCYVQLNLLPPASDGAADIRSIPASPGTAARTETSKAVSTPEFINNTFCLRMPSALGRQHTSECNNPMAAAVLQAQIMASPTIDMAPRPLSAGGRERHETLAWGTLPIQGDVALRLLNGQKAIQEIALAPAAPDQDGLALGGGYTKLGSASSEIRLQVELQLLDGGDSSGGPPPHTSGSPSSRSSAISASRSSVYTAPFSPSTHPFLRHGPSRTPTSSAAPSRRCNLAVLVSRAENIPMVTNAEGLKGPPSLFVAAKTVRQAAQRAAASAVTSAVEGSCDPVWDETLSLTFHESGMAKERVLLALVNKQTSKLLFKCSIPVGQLKPGQHYNMALQLGRARDRGRPGSGPPPRLYLTLCLSNYPSDELGWWEGLSGEELTRLSAAVDAESLPGADEHHEGIATIWKLVGDSTLAMEPPGPFSGPPRPIHQELEAEVEGEIAEWIAGKRSPSGRGPGELAEDAMPLLSCADPEAEPGSNALWGGRGIGSEAVLVVGQATRQSVDPALVLELHGLWRRPKGTEADSDNGLENVESSGNAEGLEMPEGDHAEDHDAPLMAPPLEDEEENEAPQDPEDHGDNGDPDQDKGAEQDDGARDEAEPAKEDKEEEDEEKEDEKKEDNEDNEDKGEEDKDKGKLVPEAGENEETQEERDGDAPEDAPEDAPHSLPVVDAEGVPDGLPIPTQEVAAAHDAALREAHFGPPPGSKGAELLESHGMLLGRVVIRLEDLPVDRSGDVITLRDVPILHYKGTESNPTCTLRLRLWDTESYLAHLQDTEARESQQEKPPVTPVGANWMGFLAGGEDLQNYKPPATADSSFGGGSRTMQMLVDDLLEKQTILEAFQRQVERSEAVAEQTAWRMTDLQKKHVRLQGDMVQLQQLLDEDRRAAVQSLKAAGGDLERMDRDELVSCNRALRQAADKDQRRAVELEKQLRRKHGEIVELKDLARAFSELQEAHVAQGKQLRDLEKEAARIPQYKIAIKSQESVIGRMEGMLNEALKDRQELKALREQVPRLRSENAELREARNYVTLDGDELAEASGGSRQDAVLARAAESQARSEIQELQEERLEALMKAEQAEAQRAALQSELMESTRRYAKEVASLKARLVEKDALLMGGVGAAADIALSSNLGSAAPPSEAGSQPRNSRPLSLSASRSPETSRRSQAPSSVSPGSPSRMAHASPDPAPGSPGSAGGLSSNRPRRRPSADSLRHQSSAHSGSPQRPYRDGEVSNGGGSLPPSGQPSSRDGEMPMTHGSTLSSGQASSRRSSGADPHMSGDSELLAAASWLQGDHTSSEGTRSFADGSEAGVATPDGKLRASSGSSRASRPNVRKKPVGADSRGSTASDASLHSQAPSSRPNYMQPTSASSAGGGSGGSPGSTGRTGGGSSLSRERRRPSRSSGASQNGGRNNSSREHLDSAGSAQLPHPPAVPPLELDEALEEAAMPTNNKSLSSPSVHESVAASPA